jgi:hypothetical protein
MLAMLCSIYLATQAVTCGPPMSESEAKQALLDQWRPQWLNAEAVQGEPFVIREVDPAWRQALRASLLEDARRRAAESH